MSLADWFVLGLLALAPEKNKMTSPCTLHVPVGSPLPVEYPDNAVICLASGRHSGHLFVERSVTLRGEPGAILDAGGRGSVIHVATDGTTVQIEQVTLTRGHSELGGGLRVDADSRVVLVGVTFENNRADAGEALGLVRGEVRLHDCTVTGSVHVGGFAMLYTEASKLSGQTTLVDSAEMQVTDGTLADSVRLVGRPRQQPVLHIAGARVTTIEQHPKFPGIVRQGNP